jgi:hypothetical protein
MLQESQRQLIRESEFTVVVLGKGQDFVLLRCNDDASDVAEARDAGQRGMGFCGVLALTQDGQLKADINPDNLARFTRWRLPGLHLCISSRTASNRKHNQRVTPWSGSRDCLRWTRGQTPKFAATRSVSRKSPPFGWCSRVTTRKV